MTEDRSAKPDLQPDDERTALVQRLDHYRTTVRDALIDLSWDAASSRLLPSTDMTIAGIVKHLAWAEDRWFQGRLLGSVMPTPWDRPVPTIRTTPRPPAGCAPRAPFGRTGSLS